MGLASRKLLSLASRPPTRSSKLKLRLIARMTVLNELENHELGLGSGLYREESHFEANLAGMDTYGC